jgi:acetyl-CoA acetyltransferase
VTTDFDRGWQRNKTGLGVWEHRGKVAIAGYGYSDLDRRWDGVSMDRTLGAFQADAMEKAIADAGLTPADIDGLQICPAQEGDTWRQEDRGLNRPYFDPPYDSEDGLSITTAKWLIAEFERRGHPFTNLKYVDDHAPYIGPAMGKAAQAVGDGLAKNLLMTYNMGNVEGRYHLEEGIYSAGGRQWSAPWGWMTSAMMQHAFVFLQYCTKYGGSRDNLAPFVVNQRRNGLMTPWGFYTKHEPYQITVEDYLESRPVAWPNCILDSDRPVQHAASFLFTTADRAKDMKQKPIYVLSHAQMNRPNRSTMGTIEDHEKATDDLVKILYDGAGVTAKDLDVFNPYDGFATFTQTYLEAFQWHGVKRGEAFDFYKEDIRVEGPHPFNSSGGNLGNGRTRTAMYTDSVEQLRGIAGVRQVRIKNGQPETAACGMVTPTGNGHIFLSTVAD